MFKKDPQQQQQAALDEINENMSFSVNKSTTSLSPTEHQIPATLKTRWVSLYATYLKGLAIRLLSLVIILAILIAIGIGLLYTDNLPKEEDFSHLSFDWKINPSSYLTPWNASFQYNVLLNGHAHSTYSDGKMNVRQLLDWHLANGYNAVMVTDHNTIRGGLAAEKLALAEYNQSIVVIPGMEYSCCRIHMNFIDINETIPATSPTPSDEELQRVIQKVHDLGGLVIVNHIPWSNTTEFGYQLPRLPNHPSLDQLISWGVDGFEVINQDVFDTPTYQVTAQRGLIQMVGLDIHHPSVGAQTWLTLQAANFTKAAIMQEIRAKQTSFLFDPAGTPTRVYVDSPPSYKSLLPLTLLGSYFSMFYSVSKGMYSFQGTFCQPEVFSINGSVIGWFIFWIIIFIIVFELTRLFTIWATQKILKKKS
ncbi:hypothetical protein INT47_008352 [Mucor saturninus]|uniref:Polymerase/histidinol phosphatase N-terminal domain-containing protein n=1 Tax=Mucor saturninus TaxID=64648 RepID=A0A8H7RF61_9FUNG|nr:hypothetical protein INT47_008352 [Mucor saturninus]